jgi:hypothetical protein
MVSRLWWMFAVLPPALGLAQDVASPEPAPAERVVVGEMKSLSVVQAPPEDLGKVPVGTKVTRRIILTNNIGAPIRLSVLMRTCGCLEATFDPPLVAPGQRTTFSLSSVVTPGTGAQAHFAQFQAEWEKDGEWQVEKGMCGLRFTPDVEFVVRPSAAGVTALRDGSAHVDVFIRHMEATVGEPKLVEATCSLPGWTVHRVDDSSLPQGVVRFRAQGAGQRRAGFMDGEITFKTESGVEPTIRVPVRLCTVDAYRAFPGGAVFVRKAKDGEQRITVHLIPRREFAKDPSPPASVEVQPPSPWVKADLEGENRIAVSFHPTADLEPAGASRVWVRAANGAILADFPAVWWTIPREE